MTSDDESEAASSFRRWFSDVFPNSTTFDTAPRFAAAAGHCCSPFLLLLPHPLLPSSFFLTVMHTLGRCTAGERRPHTELDQGRVSSAVGQQCRARSDGVIDERRRVDLSIERRVHTSPGWARRTSDGSVSSPKPGPSSDSVLSFLRLFLIFAFVQVLFELRGSCFYLKLFLPAKARIDEVPRPAAVDPVDPSELPRGPRSSRAFFASSKAISDRSLFPQTVPLSLFLSFFSSYRR